MKHQELVQIPDPDVCSFRSEIDRSFDGLRKTCALKTAMELGVFDILKEYTPGAEACSRMGIEELTGTMFLDALVHWGLLKSYKGCYANTSLAGNYLSEGSPYCQKQSLMHMMGNIRYWGHLTHVLKNGQPEVKMSDVYSEANIEARFSMGTGGTIGHTLRLFDHEFDMKSVGSFMAVGAASSLYAVALADRYPHMRTYVLDGERFADTAVRVLKGYGTGTEYRTGKYREGLQGSYDLVFSSVSHACLDPGFAPSAAAGLNKGGHLVVRRKTAAAAKEPFRDLEVNLTRMEVIPKGTKHHHGDEDGREYIAAMMENGLYMMDRVPWGDQEEVFVFVKP